MEASCDNLLWQGNVNTISKPNFKIYYGLMRKAAIIASIQQRSWFTKSKIAENVKKDEFIYWQNHYALDDVIEDSQCVEDFSNGSIDITEIWAKESTEENFRASTLTLHQEKIHQDNEYSNKFREHGKSPKPKSSLHKAFHTYEPEVLPHMAIVLPRPRQGRRVSTDLTEYNLPKQQYFPSQNDNLCLEQVRCKKQMPDQFQKLLDIMESLQSFDSESQLPTSSIKPKHKAYGIFPILLFVIVTILIFYFIWTISLPGEILVTFSGMYMLLFSYIYSLVN